ncbi:glycosyltransferase, partial [Microcoleus sp. HI-ES]|nr:glycosyltransferase [Microcoleus sp. HI-ES]
FCLVLAAKKLQQRAPLPIWAVLLWVVVNCLGIAVHYFFTLTLCAEAIALIAVIWQQFHGNLPVDNSQQPNIWSFQIIWRLFAVAIGTLAGGLVWLP